MKLQWRVLIDVCLLGLGLVALGASAVLTALALWIL